MTTPRQQTVRTPPRVLVRIFWVLHRWIAVTAGGFAVGLAGGVAVFGSGTGTGDLVAVGAASGLGVGPAQGPLLRGRLRAGILWVPALSGLWALGWVVSIRVVGAYLTTQRWAVFGASGAVTVALLSGVLPWVLWRETPSAPEVLA